MIRNLTNKRTFDPKTVDQTLRYWYTSAFIGETCEFNGDLWEKIF